jgi:ABC-type polysaccharide/polyol phosphate transport system ATPase subunit
MNNKIVIEFKKVSKRFKKGQRLFLKQALLDFLKPNKQEDFWALKDISFKIKRGESVGIIGVNGSGKSTILKLIAGVLSPTSGAVLIEGRIGPLIELGAGFHPELSGRDNIYLNGTILGLSKKEIDEKFDEIVKFAELADFIDTPVKHYSSGMYMRLGFSIAVASNPEILLIDEILAVGDIGFQQKCLNKIREFQKLGVTVVIISHSMELVADLVTRIYLIDGGKIKSFGTNQKVINFYKKMLAQKAIDV